MHRRDFLLGSAAGALAMGVARATTIRSSWNAVKAEFDLAPGLVHMSGFFLATHPSAVRDAIAKHRRGLDENPLWYLEEQMRTMEPAVRASAAEYMGVKEEGIAFTDSTTMGLGLVYGGLAMRPGQEILSTTHDHIATHVACEHRVARSGVGFRKVELYGDPARAETGAIAKALAAAIRPETRVLALTWVHSGTGVKLPIRALAEVVARANAGRADADRILLVVDGVHGFGLEDVSPRELGCDVFITGCHKWLFGPRGTGLVWATPQAWAQLVPTIPSFDPLWRGPELPAGSLHTPGGFHSFEHRWALEPAFRFQLRLGRAAVAKRVHTLHDALKRELARRRGFRVRTPMGAELSAGIICFEVEKAQPAEVVRRLRERGIVATVTPPFYSPTYVRLAPGLVTVEEDLERTLVALG